MARPLDELDVLRIVREEIADHERRSHSVKAGSSSNDVEQLLHPLVHPGAIGEGKLIERRSRGVGKLDGKPVSRAFGEQEHSFSGKREGAAVKGALDKLGSVKPHVLLRKLLSSDAPKLCVVAHFPSPAALDKHRIAEPAAATSGGRGGRS